MSLPVKCVMPDGSIRRVVLRDSTVASLKAQLRELFAPDAPADVVVTFQDAEGDNITIVADGELADYVKACTAESKTPRIFVVPAPAPAAAAAAAPAPAQPEPEPEPEPEDPMTRLARLLTDPARVQVLQAQLASSPVVGDAVVRVANGFVEAGPLGAWAAASRAAPELRGAAMEAVDQDVELRDALNAALDEHHAHPTWARFNPFAGGFGGFGGGGGGGPGPWPRGPWHHHGHHGPHGPHHPHHPHHHPFPFPPPPPPPPHAGMPGVHPFVVCDGCDGNPALKQAAKLAGNVSIRGWICGPRYKSKSVEDFDLCASCHSTGVVDGRRLADTLGPWEVIPPRAFAPPPTFGGHGPCAPGPHQQQRWGGPRGCRGSGRNHVAQALAETLSRCASVVAEVTGDASEVAQIARAVSESLQQSAQKEKAAAAPAPVSTPSADAAPAPAPAPAAPKPDTGVTKVEEPAAAAPAVAAASPTSSDATAEEWVVEDDPFTKWRAELARLQTLGFNVDESTVQLLEEEHGDLERVVNRIIRRNA